MGFWSYLDLTSRVHFPAHFHRHLVANLCQIQKHFRGAKMMQTFCRLPSLVRLGLHTPPGSENIWCFLFVFCPSFIPTYKVSYSDEYLC